MTTDDDDDERTNGVNISVDPDFRASSRPRTRRRRPSVRATPETLENMSAPTRKGKGSTFEADRDAIVAKGRETAEAIGKFITFGSNPEVLLRIRKQLNIQIPILPDVVITAGTDVVMMKRATDERFGTEILNYKPNLQWKCTDSWFQGDVNLDTRNHTLFYEKVFDLDAVKLKVSANFDYKDYEPYIGFQFVTSQGVTSPSTENGFSIKKKVEIKDTDALRLEADVEASLKLGATRMGGKKKLETAPATLDVQYLTFDLLLK